MVGQVNAVHFIRPAVNVLCGERRTGENIVDFAGTVPEIVEGDGNVLRQIAQRGRRMRTDLGFDAESGNPARQAQATARSDPA